MKTWRVVLIVVAILAAIGGIMFCAVLYNEYGYDHKWHQEEVCPVDAEVFWSTVPYVCPNHGVDLKVKTVRRERDGSIDVIVDKKIELGVIRPGQKFDDGTCAVMDSEGELVAGPCGVSGEQ